MQQTRRRIPLHTKIFIGLILGAIVGLTAQTLTTGASPTIDPKGLKDLIDGYIQPLGSIFLYLIFMIVVPLLLSAAEDGLRHSPASARYCPRPCCDTLKMRGEDADHAPKLRCT